MFYSINKWIKKLDFLSVNNKQKYNSSFSKLTYCLQNKLKVILKKS